MSLSTVLSAITWPNVSSGSITPIGANDPLRAQIEAYIIALYNGSPNHARPILEVAAAAGNLNFLQSSNGSQAGTIGGKSFIAFDFVEISNLFYFNNKGMLVSEKPELTVIHEIIHTTGLLDPLQPPGTAPTNTQMSAAFDFDGDAVRKQNQVAQELGYNNNIQSNYYSGMEVMSSKFYKFRTGISYSDGNVVDNVIIPENEGAGNDALDITNSYIANSRDIIFGLEGTDTLKAGGGADYVYGGTGNDQIWGGDGNDVLVGNGHDDIFYGDAGNDTIWGGEKDSSVTAGDGTDTADYSSVGSSIVITFDGATGALSVASASGGSDQLHSIETVIGTAGRDSIDLIGAIAGSGSLLTINGNGGQQPNPKAAITADKGIDVFIDSAGNGHLKNKDQSLGAGQIDLTGFGTSIHSSDEDDEITDLSVHPGRKFINSGNGDDEITVDGSDAMVSGGLGNDTITGGSGNDILLGGDGDDFVEGGAGSDYLLVKDVEVGIGDYTNNDFLSGGEGHDYIKSTLTYRFDDDIITISGGAGNDFIELDHGAGVVVEFAPGDGHDYVVGAPAIDMSSISKSQVSLIWDAVEVGHDPVHPNLDVPGHKYWYGTLVVVVGTSSIAIAGVSGSTTYMFDEAEAEDGVWDAPYDEVVLNIPALLTFSDGQDFSIDDFLGASPTVSLAFGSAAAYTTAADDFSGSTDVPPEDTNGTNAADDLSGGPGDDDIDGGGGDDSIDSSGGNDSIDGGVGNDTLYVFGERSNFVLAAAGAGMTLTDTTGLEGVQALTSVERVHFTRDARDAYLGTVGDDTIAAGGNGEEIYGLAGNDTLSGVAGDDSLTGGLGADAMAGGAGDDWYQIDDTGDVVTENADEGYDFVEASITYTLGAHLEALALAGAAATNGTGNALDNELNGNAFGNILQGLGGADLLDGGDGNDTLYGGLGDDTAAGGLGDDHVYVDSAADAVIEAAGEGLADRILASVSYTLAEGVEVELLTTASAAATAAIDLTGNELANLIFGNAGANALAGHGGNDSLNGGLGNDTLAGGLGDDFYFVDSAGDSVIEAAGEGAGDRVLAGASYTLATGAEVELLTTDSAGATTAIDLTGNELVNLVQGNAGANVLDGKGGSDTLFGFAGADAFAFTTALGAGNVDTISGFVAADDTIWLDDAVFAGLSAGALAAGAYNTGAAATQADDRIVYNTATGALLFDADGVGGAAAVQFAALATGLSLTSSDFLVV